MEHDHFLAGLLQLPLPRAFLQPVLETADSTECGSMPADCVVSVAVLSLQLVLH